jgi:transposase
MVSGYYFRFLNNTLDQLSKTELIVLLGVWEKELESNTKVIECKDQRIEKLEGILAKFQKMLFGHKRERFESPDQLSLPFETTAEQQQELTEKVACVGKKSRAPPSGRTKLPEHLAVEEIELHPPGDLSAMTCVGKEVTEELDYIPGSYIIRRYIRYTYVSKVQEGKSVLAIAPLPSRLIDKSSVGNGLLASILTDKYVDHLPLYRQLQHFKRENIPISRFHTGRLGETGNGTAGNPL